jgi:hypothetical protein
MDSDLLRVARDATGFMPEEEGPAVCDIGRTGGHDQDERREHEGQPDERRPEYSVMHEAEVVGKLGRQWAGRELRKGEPDVVVLGRDPLPALDEVTAHVSNERDRSSEADRAQL